MKAVAQAPSKAIITGEHFVVHGAWALAAALPKTVTVEVEDSERFKVASDVFPRADPPQLRPVAEVVESMAREFSFSPKVKVTVTSEIPQGAGLGSSASTMVALASALSRLRSLGLGAEEVIRFSMLGERNIHGRPSGIDSNICARGGIILFRPGSRPRKVILDRRRSLLLSFSGKTRSTKRQINRVSAVKEGFPSLFSGLTEAVSGASLMAARRLANGDMKSLGGIFTFNHSVLATLGVSNRTLDRIVGLLVSSGAYGAKLTGAGGGGSVVAVAPEAKEKSIISRLNARGFETFRAQIPVEGVKSWRRR